METLKKDFGLTVAPCLEQKLFSRTGSALLIFLHLLQHGPQQQTLGSLEDDVVNGQSVRVLLVVDTLLRSTRSQVADHERSHDQKARRLHGNVVGPAFNKEELTHQKKNALDSAVLPQI